MAVDNPTDPAAPPAVDPSQPAPQPAPEPPAPTAPTDSAPAPTEPQAPADAPPAPAGPPAAAPVTVDNFTRRSDDDAIHGSWVDVISGPHAGRFGAYVEDAAHDPLSGYPVVIVVRSRDALNELLHVNYADVRPSERTGGR